MSPDKLILRTLPTAFSAFPDITLGSVLSHEELDGNFIYLKGEVIHDAVIDNEANLILNKINGNDIILPLSAVTITAVTTDTFVTGGTYDAISTITFNDNQGGTFGVTGIADTNTFATGLTYNSISDLLTLNNNDGSTLTTSGFTSSLIDNNEFTTGGTFTESASTITFTSNSGNTFDVTGVDVTDTFVTGGTYDSGTTSLDFNDNQGGTFNVPIIDNNDNEFTSGGTLDLSAGTITFTTNSGNTYDVTNFNSLSDKVITGGTYSSSANTLTLIDSEDNNVIITGFTTTSSGLEAIDEGNGIGWRLIGRDPNFYGNVGLDATDLSYSSVSGTPRGAIGTRTLALGENTTASAINSLAGGVNTLANGTNAFAFGNATQATGGNSFAIGEGATASGLRTFAGGASSQSTGNFSFAFGNSAIASSDGSVSLGSGIASNTYSVALGDNNISRFDSETVVGRYNVDNGLVVPNTPDAIDSKLFTVGNGTDNLNRSDAFTIYNNGAALFSPLSSTTVGNGTKGMYIYDEIDDRPKYHDGTQWVDFGISAFTDTFVTGGTYETSASTINFTDNQGGTFTVTGITTNFNVIDGYEEFFASGGETGMTVTNTVQVGRHFQLFRNGQLDLFGLNNEYEFNVTLDGIIFASPLVDGEIIQFYYKYITT